MPEVKQSGASESNPFEGISYEQAFNELETIVATLEAGEKSLEDTLELFERGQGLARYCTDLLEKAELRVQQLSANGLVDFEPNEKDTP